MWYHTYKLWKVFIYLIYFKIPLEEKIKKLVGTKCFFLMFAMKQKNCMKKKHNIMLLGIVVSALSLWVHQSLFLFLLNSNKYSTVLVTTSDFSLWPLIGCFIFFGETKDALEFCIIILDNFGTNLVIVTVLPYPLWQT